jgi:hypothetical protein
MAAWASLVTVVRLSSGVVVRQLIQVLMAMVASALTVAAVGVVTARVAVA